MKTLLEEFCIFKNICAYVHIYMYMYEEKIPQLFLRFMNKIKNASTSATFFGSSEIEKI